MNYELERMWKKVAAALFEVISRYIPGGTGENQGKIQPELPVSGLRFETVTSLIQSSNKAQYLLTN
jgi:hypothetical protein